MSQEKNNLIFFTMGEMYSKQCLFAVLSLLKVYNRSLPKTMHLYIYTDQPDFFSLLEERYPISTIFIDESRINRWSKAQDYFFINKISLIKEFLESHEGNMLYADTDVIFKKKLESTFEKIANGNYVLHLREEKLSSRRNRHFLSSFPENKFTLKSGRRIEVDNNSEMWNAGFIGVSSENSAIIDDVLDLCLQMLPHSSSVFQEQLSFSLVFKSTGKLIGDHSKLIHYWWKKRSFTSIIEKSIDEGYPNLEYLLDRTHKWDPTNRTFSTRLFYTLHPNSFLRKSFLKTSLLLNIPIH